MEVDLGDMAAAGGHRRRGVQLSESFCKHFGVASANVLVTQCVQYPISGNVSCRPLVYYSSFFPTYRKKSILLRLGWATKIGD